MKLIFGGAYQGKLEYAEKNYDIKTVFDCGAGATPEAPGTEPDFGKDAVCALEKFVLKCVRDGVEAADYFKENKEKWQDKVLILTDVSQGIVPMDAELRAFREMNGRLMLYLAAEADEVVRVFCGIGKRVK
ncbi:MAG: bifunctional adenosylcobinamide kinase/adenosylcobinamide-phosphate guanylyltransferase [Bacillota bacterium]|nr:bifunctional adenosylcobinamide kinase/adenosylcobinamide-phosphate guanylyltransferase [Bacillota bacterium]